MKTILNEREFSPEESEAATQRNNSKMPIVFFQLGDDQVNCLLTEFNHIESDRYYDPINKAVFSVDPFTLVVSNITAFKPDDNNSAEGKNFKIEEADPELYTSVLKYAEETYPKGSWGLYTKDTVTNIVLVGARSEPKNFWSGQWSSVWTVTKETLSAKIKITVHYHEEGNIQLETLKSFSFDLSEDAKIVDIIKEAEDSLQLSLNEAYQSLSQATFKRLRRQLPITRTKMDWTKIGAYGLGSELSSKKQ